MAPGCDPAALASQYTKSNAILLDAYDAKAKGGTGEVFDWARIPTDLNKPLILAGGLSISNVAAAIAQVKPYAIDVSSGVESSKGIKDPQKISEFLQKVRGV